MPVITSPVRRRPLGRTGLEISEIGFGSWGIGGLTGGLTSYGATDDAISRAALQQAISRGIIFFDTAPAYGNGHSEELVGAEASGIADAVIATKAGIETFDGVADFSPDALRRSLDASRRRLRRKRIDLVQLHNPTFTQLKEQPQILAYLRDEATRGAIGAYGVSVKAPADAIPMITELSVPVVQVNLNMLDRRAIECGLLDLAQDRGTGVIGRTPLCFGFLSGAVSEESDFAPGDHRRGWPKVRIRHWAEGARAMLPLVRSGGVQTAAQKALRFCLSVPGISCVIPGILTPEEAEENAGASRLGALSSIEASRIAAAYQAWERRSPERSAVSAGALVAEKSLDNQLADGH